MLDGYMKLATAAKKIGRSTARTRQYVTSGMIPFKRDEFGRIWIKDGDLDAFVPPDRSRRSGGTEVKVGTRLRHAKATRSMLEQLEKSPDTVIALKVLEGLIGTLAAEAAAAGEDVEGSDEETEDNGNGDEDAEDAEDEPEFTLDDLTKDEK